MSGMLPGRPESIRDLPGSIRDLPGSIPDIPGSIKDLPGSIRDLLGSIPDIKSLKNVRSGMLPGRLGRIRDIKI